MKVPNSLEISKGSSKDKVLRVHATERNPKEKIQPKGKKALMA
jgi:hypothetical protein